MNFEFQKWREYLDHQNEQHRLKKKFAQRIEARSEVPKLWSAPREGNFGPVGEGSE
jgi:hypothetical protein